MAILKMKRLRLVIVRSRKDELLRELQKHGCVEFSEIGEEIQGSEAEKILSREESKVMAVKAKHSALSHAITLLNKYAPAKSKLLSATPEVDSEELISEEGINAALAVAERITAADDKIKRLSAEESRQRGIIESLEPWLNLELSLDTEGTERTSLVMGSIPAKIKLSDVESALSQASDEAELFTVSKDKTQNYVLVVCIKEALTAVQECLRGFNFSAVSFSGMQGSARECTLRANEALTELGKEKIACAEQIKSENVHRESLKMACDRVSTMTALAEAEDKLYGTETTVMMEGWVPEENVKELEEIFESYDCAWDTRDPEEEEYPSVPVKLKNNAVTNSLNMVTNMYSLPTYGTVDANPLMAPFFILFYGLMMADMGYGIIMIAAALVAMAKIKPRGGTQAFCQLLLYAGIATFVMGALTGGLFGDAPYRIVHMINPQSTWEGLPYLFSPVNDSELVLYGAMVLGVIHLNFGMIISFVEKKKNGNLMDGIFEEGPLWVILVGGVLLALGMMDIVPALALPGKIVIIVGLILLLFGAGRHSKGIFGKIGAAFGCIYNTATGWFGDILSYSRIMALMLAGGVVAQVFNTIAVMPAESMGLNVGTVLAFLLIFLVGHALNFGLNLLGCFVHDLRLQCLEFFGKFYSDGGKPFNPLAVRSKYVRAKEN